MKKLVLIISAVAIAAGIAYVVVKTVEELRFEEEEELTSSDIESQLLQHE
jgi:ammonia channel protein AmtB